MEGVKVKIPLMVKRELMKFQTMTIDLMVVKGCVKVSIDPLG